MQETQSFPTLFFRDAAALSSHKMLSQKVFSKSAHTQKVGGWGKILAWLSNVRVRQTNFKAKVVGNTHTRTHVQPVKVTNRVAIKFHMLITCVALVASPPT